MNPAASIVRVDAFRELLDATTQFASRFPEGECDAEFLLAFMRGWTAQAEKEAQ